MKKRQNKLQQNYTAIIPKRAARGIILKVEDLCDLIKKFIYKGSKH